MSEVYPDGASVLFNPPSNDWLIRLQLDPPMRRFAQRHTYSNVDAIAIRDLGWMPGGASSGSSNGSLRHDSSLGAMSGSSGIFGATSGQKRPASPERGKSGSGHSISQDMGPPPPKRAREVSPPPRDRDRDRRDRERDRRDMPPPPRRRYGSPDWGRGSPPRRGGDVPARSDWDRDGPGQDDRGPGGTPGVATWFLGQLPPSSTFDGKQARFCHYYPLTQRGLGPVFRVDDLLQVFRNASIPGPTGASRPRSPPRVFHSSSAF